MTVYNHRQDAAGAQVWHRSVVRGVQWRHNRNELTETNKIQTVNRVESITIDFDREYAGNTPYLEPNEYNDIPFDKVPEGWTLNKGYDILVLGECAEEISTERVIYELKKRYQYVATVTAVSDNRNVSRLKHIKVVAK